MGKTSLLQKVFPSHRFVSLDLPSVAEQADCDPRTFLGTYPPPVVIDEVQYAPSIFRHIKAHVDRNRAQPGQFVLTGSQKFTLMQGVSESLAGRAEILELESLSIQEILGALGARKRLEQPMDLPALMLRGTYPELHANIGLDPVAFCRSYVATFLERDLRSQLQVTHLRDFERFLRACALRSGQMLNKAELARDVGISPSTANEWLSVLQASNQVILLEPWFSNHSKSIVKTPKLYIGDSGVLLFLLGIRTIDDLLNSPLVGAIWETFVFSELRKQEAARSGGTEALYYWRDRIREVDFLIHRGGRFELYEAKWTEFPSSHDSSNLGYLARQLGKERVISETARRATWVGQVFAGVTRSGKQKARAKATRSVRACPSERPPDRNGMIPGCSYYNQNMTLASRSGIIESWNAGRLRLKSNYSISFF